METIKNIFIAIVLVGLVGVAGYSFGNQSNQLGSVGTNSQAYGFKGTTTSTVVSISTASSTILGVNPDADFRQICIAPSSSESTIISLKMVNGSANGNVPTSTIGLKLASTTQKCITFDQTNPYFGGVNAACSVSCWANVLDY